MTPLKIALAGIVLFTAACGPETSAAPTSSAAPSSTPVTSAALLAAGGLLVAIKTEHHPDHDRLILEFGGPKVPDHIVKYVDEVREDPSDRPVTLLGSAFLQIVFFGGTLDTSPRESDPSKVERYTGPRRVTPDLAILKEVAVTGDFEAHLSFGIGLSRMAEFKVETLTAPARVVIELR